jgi:hypothetical protein
MSETEATVRIAAAPRESSRWYASTAAVVAGIATLKLLLQLATDGRYGYFRDELYYIVCSRHLAMGYVDQPPLIAALVWLELHIGGTSLNALRFLPAVAGAALVVIAALLAREMGARKFGTWFAALATACIAIGFAMNYLMTMNAFEPLLWMICAYIVVRIINTDNQKLWLWFGAVAGIGLENKYSMGIFGFALMIGLLLTAQRKAFGKRWIWIGAVVALAIFLPNLLWQIRHGWPFIELMRNVHASESNVQPAQYFAQQIIIIGPVLFPIWFAGLLYLFFGKEGHRYRAMGWSYVLAFAVMIAMKGKNYYLAPAYAMLMAAGAVSIEKFLERRAWLKPATVTVILLATAMLLPLTIPIFSPAALAQYIAELPVKLPLTQKSFRGEVLPQQFADQFGWREMTSAVARVYDALPPAERGEACIFGENYGEASAINFFGERYGLPPALSGNQTYFYWGPGKCTGAVLIVLGSEPETWRSLCDRVDVAADLDDRYGMLIEDRPVLVCHTLQMNLHQAWPHWKNWN